MIHYWWKLKETFSKNAYKKYLFHFLDIIKYKFIMSVNLHNTILRITNKKTTNNSILLDSVNNIFISKNLIQSKIYI